jgi:hypothetical protein
VPLLVSMFADSTPASIEDMIDVFQENSETTLVLGTSYRACNFELFTSADLSIAISTLPQGMTYDEFPSINAIHESRTSSSSSNPKTKSEMNSASSQKQQQQQQQHCQLVKSDLKFNEKIIALSSCLILPNTPSHEESCLSHVTELLHEGRRLLMNIHQMYTFIINYVGILAVIIALEFLAPVSSASHFHLMSLVEFQIVILFFVTLPMLITNTHNSLIKQTQCKNDKYSNVNNSDIHRFWLILYGRTIPIGFVCYVMKIWSFGLYLMQTEKDLRLSSSSSSTTTPPQVGDDDLIAQPQGDDDLLDSNFHYCHRLHEGLKWYDYLWCQEIENDRHLNLEYQKHLHYAHVSSHMIMMLFLLLNVLVQSSSFLFRTKSILVLSPIKNNKYWFIGCLLAFIFHVLYSLVYLYLIIGKLDFKYLTWELFLCMVIFPFVGLFLYEEIKAYDAKSYDRFMRFLQLEFDTRLGMYSPR